MTNTELFNDVKRVITDALGELVAKQIENFDDPKLYPKDFLDECVYFLGKLIGPELAREKFKPLYKKYKIEPP